MRTHLVIGDGITAVAFIENSGLVSGDALIILGEHASQLGRGAAYAGQASDKPWRYAYLLNSPADDIDPAFSRWLSEKWDDIQETMRGRSPDWLKAAQPLVDAGDIYGVNAPREFYGDFVAEQVEELLAKLRDHGVSVRIVDDVAIGMERVDGQLRVRTESGQTFTADSVDVAPGGPETLRIPGDDGHFSVDTLFGHEDEIAEHIKRGAEIFCIGGNAAMLDTLRLCQSLIPDEALRFVACAPDGEVPPALIPRLPRKLTQPLLSTGHATADGFLEDVRRAISTARESGDDTREIRAGFRAHFLDHGMSKYVADQQEARQIPVTLRFWLRGGTRDTILDMHDLIERGKACIVKGMVVAIEHESDHARVVMRDEEGEEFTRDTGFVVNCAGAGANSAYDPLTEQMLKNGWIKKCPVNKGLSVGERCLTGLPNVRYLSPSVTEIGDEVMAMPLYDAHMLRTYARRSYA